MPRKIVSPLQRRYELPCAYLHNRHVAVAEGEEQPVKVVLILLPTSHQCHLASERDLEARRDGLHDLPLAAVARVEDNDGDDDAPARAPQAGFPSSGSSGSRAREQE